MLSSLRLGCIWYGAAFREKSLQTESCVFSGKAWSPIRATVSECSVQSTCPSQWHTWLCHHFLRTCEIYQYYKIACGKASALTNRSNESSFGGWLLSQSPAKSHVINTETFFIRQSHIWALMCTIVNIDWHRVYNENRCEDAKFKIVPVAVLDFVHLRLAQSAGALSLDLIKLDQGSQSLQDEVSAGLLVPARLIHSVWLRDPTHMIIWSVQS